MFRKIAMALAGLAALAVLGILIFGPRVSISIPETQAQAELAAMLPMTIEKNGVNVVLRSAELDFRADNRVRITADLDIAGYGLSGAGRADATSGLRYEGGNFYLSEISVSDMDITPDAPSSSRIKDATTAFSGLLDRARDAVAADRPEAAPAFDRLRAEAAERLAPRAREAVDQILTQVPVYSLNGKDLAHSAAALALEDISFGEDQVTATLNPQRLILKVLGGIALLILATLGSLGWFASIGGLGRP